MLFLGKEFSDVVVVTLISPLAAFYLEPRPANSCSERCGLHMCDVKSLFVFAYSLFLKL